jgi:hypothetical protein
VQKLTSAHEAITSAKSEKGSHKKIKPRKNLTAKIPPTQREIRRIIFTFSLGGFNG